ncbi:MAG: molybdopterin-guanine dinucleotide biosynthesis protein B [Thermoleophilia bacterium]|nr:molybdopterin-guanine dinucleotide biosynthesis protein B [Thermoleophilia bacterium]
MVDFSIAILAGGKSRRMGSNKALLALGGRPVVTHVIESFRPLSDDVFMVGGTASDYEEFGLPHVADQYSLRASIVGIYTALAAARHSHCLVVSCDMPFVPPGLAAGLAAAAPGRDAVVPLSEKGLEPLCALYSRSCAGALRRQIENGELAVKAALDRLNVHQLDAGRAGGGFDRDSFFNLNTREDLRQAERILSARAGKPAGSPAETAQKGSDLPFSGKRRPPLVCFVGKKNSGKTTFLEKLVPLLASMGLKTAFIKHDVHGFEMDREGTDTWRMARAGAREVFISSPEAMAAVRRVDAELSLEELYRQVNGSVDIVLVEGFKSAGADRIEISRSGRSRTLACREEDLVVVISDTPRAACTVPVFGLDDADAVARFLVERYRLHLDAVEEGC